MESRDIEAAAKRLCRLSAHIDADTWQAGAEWYPREAAWIGRVAASYGTRLDLAINAYACLSPRAQVGHNRASFAALLKGKRPPALRRQVAAARRALHGDFGLHVSGVGLKVEAFAANLSGCPDAITVDTWAARAAGLEPPTTDARYVRSAHAYRLAAARLGQPVRTLQAATWLHVRGVKPSDAREA